MVLSLYKGLSVNEIGNHFRGKWLPNTRLYSLVSFLFQSFSLNTSLNRYSAQFSSVQFSCSAASDSATPSTAAHQTSLSITNSWSLLKLLSIELVMPSNHLILCCPLLLLPSIFPRIRSFSNQSVLGISWPMYWSFSLNISPSNEYSGLISFRMD